MNFDWRKLDLKKSCIFDLTDDIEMIRQCTCRRTITLEDREEYLSDGGSLHYIPCAMGDFAHYSGDKELEAELNRIFVKEFAEVDALFDE